jgi:tetratricopeptide (TPR) repeat protein
MEKNGRLEEAELFYGKSIEIAGENIPQPDSFYRLYRIYKRQKNEEKALETLRLGISYLPDHAQFRVLLGDYYLSKGIPYRAQEEYMQALRLNPKNRAVQLKLDKMRSEE